MASRIADVVKTPSESALRREHRIAALVIGLPTLGVLLAPLWWARFGVTALDLGLFAAFYLPTMLAVSVGFHRLFTHRSFDAPPGVELSLGILGCMAWLGPIVRFSADHRRHHLFTDKEGDPHSPGAGSSREIFHSHVGWLFDRAKSRAHRLVPDLLEDETVQFVDRHYAAWATLSLLLPAATGAVIGRTWHAVGGAPVRGARPDLRRPECVLAHRVGLSSRRTTSLCDRRPVEQQSGPGAARRRRGLAQHASRFPGVAADRSRACTARLGLVRDLVSLEARAGTITAPSQEEPRLGQPDRLA